MLFVDATAALLWAGIVGFVVWGLIAQQEDHP
jgi:hypothetical protein